MQIPRQVFARSLAALLLGVATALAATGSDIPPHGKAVALFNGRDLGNFETFLRDQGLNHDPDHVFRVEKHVIHVSGKEFGYIITRKEFANYYLRAEFKWGEGTYAPRQGQARDSGILYHVQGPQKVWPTSIEFQILEGGTGDFWMTDGGALTGSNGVRVRLWKRELQVLADELRIAITVCHLPPGTSKWNRIEHRLFAFITQNWRGKPLVSHQVIVQLIANTRTEAGLTVACRIDTGAYQKGIKVSDDEMDALNIQLANFHGEWNYTFTPRQPDT